MAAQIPAAALSARDRAPVAFFSQSDANYFPGLIAMYNSLRLLGHREPVVVYDCGLEPSQRARLEPVATVVRASQPAHPRLAKTYGPRAHPASDVLALVDADVIFVRPLDSLLGLAADGHIVAFADDQPERFFPEWRDHLAVERLHRHTYVNAGLLLLPGDLAPRLLATVADLHSRIDFRRSRGLGRGTMADPFHLPDQDCWNAALAAHVPPERMITLEHALAPFQPWERVVLEDAGSLRCRIRDGREPHLLHHIDDKPWLTPTPRSAYSALLRRLLHGDDVALALKMDLPPDLSRRAAAAREAAKLVQRMTAARRGAPRTS